MCISFFDCILNCGAQVKELIKEGKSCKKQGCSQSRVKEGNEPFRTQAQAANENSSCYHNAIIRKDFKSKKFQNHFFLLIALEYVSYVFTSLLNIINWKNRNTRAEPKTR